MDMAFRRTLGVHILLIIMIFIIWRCSSSSSIEAGMLNPKNGLFSLRAFKQRQRIQKPSNFSTIISKNTKATILELKHRDYYKDRGWNRRNKNRLIADQTRVHSIQNQFKTVISGQLQSLSQTGIPIASGVKLQTLNYIVTAAFGNQNLSVIVDTGSDLTWVQCQPCSFCYNQPEPLFNPSISFSYKPIACNSSSCQSLQSATGNSGQCGSDFDKCNYMVSYGDGSYTRGELGKEKLVLGSAQIDDFVFGCGRNNNGLFGEASGLMGLGRSDLSLIYQTFDKFNGVFSYCLPSTESDSSGSLIFGDDLTIYQNSSPISYTRMVPNPKLPTFYFLNLTGITINGDQVQDQSFGITPFLIDSGTVITRLLPSMYKAVKDQFLKHFSGFPIAPGFSILDTCFNLSAYDKIKVPNINLQFEGDAEMNVDTSGMFYFVKSDASQVCLAFASLQFEDGIGIMGNYQQRNTRIIYDTKDFMVGFAQETCNFI